MRSRKEDLREGVADVFTSGAGDIYILLLVEGRR
jgi:hypothetical protein